MNGPLAAGPHDLGGGISLRPLEPSAASRLATACCAIDPYRTLGYSAGGLAAYLTRPDPSLSRFEIVSSGLCGGVVVLRSPWLRGPLIEMLAILPDMQGQGLGRATVQWILQTLPASTNLWATVSDFNHQARAFYARLNFVETASLPGLVDDRFAEILLRARATS